ALGLGLAACQKGLSVGFITASALVHELLEARDEKRLLRLQRQLAGYKLLIIDEFGYVPLSATGAELLFEVFSQRYERGSMDLPCKSGEPSPMKDSGGGDEQEQTKTIYERVQTGGGAADADQRTQRRAGCK